MNIQRAFHILVGTILLGTILLSLPQQGFSSSLHTAAAEGKTEDILKLLKNGADINERDKGGLTPLLLAAHFGYPETVSCLLDHGADIKATDKRGRTAILTAFTQVGKWLLFSSGRLLRLRNLWRKVSMSMQKMLVEPL